MRIILKHLILSAVVALSLGFNAPAAERTLTLGTGGVTGVYYPMGVDICRLVNTAQREHGLRCVAKRTDGSVYNRSLITSMNSGHCTRPSRVSRKRPWSGKATACRGIRGPSATSRRWG